MSSEHNRSSIVTPDEAMSRYFGDLLGDAAPTTEACKRDPLSMLPSMPLLSPNTIEPGYWLVSTISLQDRIVDYSQPRRSMSDSFLLLLCGLYYLRQPIFGRLRAQMLEYCHETMMEYHLLQSLLLSESVEGDGE